MLDDLERLAKAATPRRWKWINKRTLWAYVNSKNESLIWTDNIPGGPEEELTWAKALGACGDRAEADAEANAAYIAALSPERVLTLIACVRAAKEVSRALQVFWRADDPDVETLDAAEKALAAAIRAIAAEGKL